MSAVVSNSHTFAAPLPWVVCQAAGLPAGTSVLGVVCGSGRHVRQLVACGLCLTGIDHDAAALSGLAGTVETTIADIEDGSWSLSADATFDAVVVMNHLHRPFRSHLLVAIVPGGRPVYETFADGNETVGKPSNSAFLLTPGELSDVMRDLMRMIGYKDDSLASPQDVYLRWIRAVREPSGTVAPRYAL